MSSAMVPVKGSVIPSPDDWATIYNMGKALLPTGFLPAAIKTAEQATAIILKGRELGVPPMYALSNITVIQGKPTCNAELMLALVRRDHGSNVIRVKHSDNERCIVQWKTWGEISEYAFTMDDARRAGLLSNQTWTKYPAAMLRARCISAVCRMAFPESIAGMYTAEELGGPAMVDLDEVPAIATVAGAQVNTATGEILDARVAVAPGPVQAVEMVERSQLDLISVLINQKGLTAAGVRTMAGGKGARELTWDEAETLIEAMQDYPDLVLDEPDDEPVNYDPRAEQEVLGSDEIAFAGNPDRFTR